MVNQAHLLSMSEIIEQRNDHLPLSYDFEIHLHFYKQENITAWFFTNLDDEIYLNVITYVQNVPMACYLNK